jgi:DNA-directed RNA polymerase specialized sigma24 family protein
MRSDGPTRLEGAARSSLGDAKVARQTQEDGVSAFEYLCRRHIGPAWDLAYAVTGERRDAAAAVAEAFVRVLRPGRPARFDSPDQLETALLSATRAAAIEAARRPHPEVAGQPAAGVDGEHVGGATRFEGEPGSRLPIVTAAYRSLPERWRSVLWLTEVLHTDMNETAAVLGVSGNGLAQLGHRARSGLRERYLQAQLRGSVAAGCHPTVEHLAAFTASTLAPPELGTVENHLRGCHDCQEREAELDELGAMLTRIGVPTPPTLVAMATSRWKDAANAATVVPRTPLRLLSFPNSGRKPVAGAALAVMGLGIIGAAVVSGPLLTHGPGSGGLAPAAAAPTEVNQSGATGGANPFLLSGNQAPAPTTGAPTTSTSTAAAGGGGGAFTTPATAASGGGRAPAGGGGASTAGLVPATPSAPPTTSIVPKVPPPPPPLPVITPPPVTLPPVTVPSSLLPNLPKLLP